MKYEFTGETRRVEIPTAIEGESEFHTVHRIRAVRDITTEELTEDITPLIQVTAGTLGGWISKDVDLSHEGECWVGDEAIVAGASTIRDDAKVTDQAVVFDSIIMDKARVFEHALVTGKCLVSKYSNVFGGCIVRNGSILSNASVYGSAKVSESTIDNGYANDWSQVSDGSVIDQYSVVTEFARVASSLVSTTRVGGTARTKGATLSGTGIRVGEFNDCTITGMGARLHFEGVGTDFGVLTMYLNNDDKLTLHRGCFLGNLEQFTAASKLKHTPEVFQEYQELIAIGERRLRRLKEQA